jgi:hypothetical protein
MSERTEDLIMVGVDKRVKELLEKYYKNHLGDRIGEVEDGNIYSQGKRNGIGNSEEIGNIVQQPPIGQPGD